MIDPIKIAIKYSKMEIFKEIDYISFDENADIEIKSLNDGWIVTANDKVEFWVKTLEDRIKLKRTGVVATIIILTTDDELLPYCMKDRLAYLQDRTNKEKNV